MEQYWDNYNPPESGYRGVYLQQISLEQTFFGWLYNDGSDDLGRAHIPYFICYFLVGQLDISLLNTLWKCLEVGPVMVIDRQNPPRSIENILIPKSCNYQSPRLGVSVTQNIQQQSQKDLQQGRLINQFIAEDLKMTTINAHPASYKYTDQPLTSLPLGSQFSQKKFMNTPTIEEIIQDLAMKAIGIQGISLVSQEGKPITVPIGLDEDSTSIISGTMLYAAHTSFSEFNWQDIEMISVRGKEGHVILAYCNPEIYLLVKAGKVLTGLLEAEISRTVKKIQTALQSTESLLLPSGISPKILDESLSVHHDYPEELGEEIYRETDNQMRYPGKASAFQKVPQQKLIQMAQNLINSYPDLVAAVRDIDNNPEISTQNMLKLGQYVGQGLVAQEKIKQVSIQNMPSSIKKLVLPAISPFVIADVQGNELKVHANPFCMHKTSDQPSCYFLRGMIQGLLQSVPNLPEFTVDETSCKATGADSCTFKIGS